MDAKMLSQKFAEMQSTVGGLVEQMGTLREVVDSKLQAIDQKAADGAAQIQNKLAEVEGQVAALKALTAVRFFVILYLATVLKRGRLFHWVIRHLRTDICGPTLADRHLRTRHLRTMAGKFFSMCKKHTKFKKSLH